MQSTYSTTAINFDFALITLISDVAPSLGYFGIERGTGDVKYDINSAGYPADKSTGSMWLTTCSNVEYDFGDNQGVFKDVSQCANNVSTLSPIPQRALHTFTSADDDAEAVLTSQSTAHVSARPEIPAISQSLNNASTSPWLS